MKRLNYQKGMSPIIAIILLAVILIIGGAYYFKQKQQVKNPTIVMNQAPCTMEAKLCPDGKTYVGRQGPKCEFAACP